MWETRSSSARIVYATLRKRSFSAAAKRKSRIESAGQTFGRGPENLRRERIVVYGAGNNHGARHENEVSQHVVPGKRVVVAADQVGEELERILEFLGKCVAHVFALPRDVAGQSGDQASLTGRIAMSLGEIRLDDRGKDFLAPAFFHGAQPDLPR